MNMIKNRTFQEGLEVIICIVFLGITLDCAYFTLNNTKLTDIIILTVAFLCIITVFMSATYLGAKNVAWPASFNLKMIALSTIILFLELMLFYIFPITENIIGLLVLVIIDTVIILAS